MAARGMNVDDVNYTHPTGYTGYALDPKVNPEAMDGFLDIGMKVLDCAGKIPKAMFKQCAGIMLLDAEESGLGVSVQGGSGVALAHKDDKWSNPIAVNMTSMGAGFVFGYAEKQVIIFLNHFAMDKLLEGKGSFNIGADAGFAVGKYGREAAGALAVSDAGGLGSSFTYTFAKGALVSVEGVIGSRITPPSKPHEKFYGTDNQFDILNGKVSAPDGSKVPALQEKLAQLEGGEEAEENK